MFKYRLFVLHFYIFKKLNKLFQTLICVLIYATKETLFQQYFALKMCTFSRSSYPFFRPFEIRISQSNANQS